jgi:hypothetical protein
MNLAPVPKRRTELALALMLAWMATGCRSPDPAAGFIAQMDRAPAAQHPKNWEQTKSLMARKAPKVGQPAPDFSLPTLDGTATNTLSQRQAGRPMVLIFGSFT